MRRTTARMASSLAALSSPTRAKVARACRSRLHRDHRTADHVGNVDHQILAAPSPLTTVLQRLRRQVNKLKLPVTRTQPDSNAGNDGQTGARVTTSCNPPSPSTAFIRFARLRRARRYERTGIVRLRQSHYRKPSSNVWASANEHLARASRAPPRAPSVAPAAPAEGVAFPPSRSGRYRT